MASFILITSIIAWLRRKQLPEQERFSIKFRMRAPGWEGGIWDKALSIILMVSIAGAVSTLGYTVISPKIEKPFTEFYILGLSGEATNYPKELMVGEEGKVIASIINHEHKLVTYRVEVMVDGVKNREIEPVPLKHNEKWEGIVVFTPHRVGNSQKVEFLLYKQGQNEAYQRLHLWLDVIE